MSARTTMSTSLSYRFQEFQNNEQEVSRFWRLGDVEEREEHDIRYDTKNECVGKASRRNARSST